MKTVTGSFPVDPSEQDCLKGLVDPQKALQQRRALALETKNVCECDHTKELVNLTGFFEAMGAENIYMSETHRFFKEDPQVRGAVSYLDSLDYLML